MTRGTGLMSNLVQLIETRLNSPLLMNELASVTGYTERWLYATFKRYTGLSVTQYIRRRKLTLAAAMLRNTNRPVTDISLMYGFESLQHFSRAFRQQYHVSPVTYRRADHWDMACGQPILYNTSDNFSAEFIYVSGKAFQVPDSASKFRKIYLGKDYINSYRNGEFIYNNALYKAVVEIYEQTSQMNNFLIEGEMVPGKLTETVISYYIRELISHENAIEYVKPGTYLEIACAGDYDALAKFHMYDCYNVLCRKRCLLKRGHVFSIFRRRNNCDILDSRIFYPCANTLLPDTLKA